ncbi:MAG: FAD-dependent oxidoreductase [Deltaproteobacteria bacterium]|jgi:NADH-quinone oxidoreductase subunit F|nr:FAD-dependent oxidoreductase [Deltaproteobacteria bacterium]MBW2532825.1 FAD-dependent oxidoreductase [Deltaproteobacteria bacterium]
MTQLTLEGLRELRARLINDYDSSIKRIVVGAGTACQASGANAIQRLLKRQIYERDLVERIKLRITGDHGFCVMAPYLLIEPDQIFYVKVQPEDVPRIVRSVLSGEVIEDLLYQDPATGKRYAHPEEIPFFQKQLRTLLGKNQRVDPIRLYAYVRDGGYQALAKALGEMTPEQILEEVKASKLRGRGGAGFPTGRKWELAAAQDGSRGKYVVCNADEGDPGAYMDRGILEGNPHSVIEGMIIGARAMGANEGYIYVRHEYPLAIKNCIIALRLARSYGLLGKNILGTGFDFDIQIVKGAGAFVCGEETALIRSIEGYMGEPRQRPPYPIERGIYGRPTSINNVETWANVREIIQHGGEAFAGVGTANSTGTKVFSLVGKVRHTGLVEVPMGTTIRELVYDIGGGTDEGGKVKAVQIGGPSGGCIPQSRFDLPIDYDSLTEAGAIMGSGGMIVMDENTCMVDVAKYFMNFLRDESCGKCFTCRKGTQRMYEILDDITRGKGTPDSLKLLSELAQTVKDTTQCGLGQSAPNPVLSTLRYFRKEYERHIYDKKCDAYVCKDLVGAPCQSACPVGTEAWKYVAHIAEGEYEKAYVAIREHNPFPSVCARVCDHKCEQRCRLGAAGEGSVAIRSLKRFITDKIDPSVYQPERVKTNGAARKRVAVVGSGPGGLSAAHYLSLRGYAVTIYEAAKEPGGMLVSGVPSYRLPRDVLDKEIKALLDENITLKCETALGRDLTIDGLFADGFSAVFLALGAHRSRKMGIDGEDAEGVYPSIQFLKAWNHEGKVLCKGKVGIIGGGNSAVDAARVARRQEGVESVTILYRRTRHEMPAYEEEIDAAIEEGIELKTLISPVSIKTEGGKLTAVEFIDNDLGEIDSSGRRRPVPRQGSEHAIELDTLVVAIGEQTLPFELQGSDGLEFTSWGSLAVKEDTLETSRKGVFGGGDVVTGPNTVIDAVAAGKKAAVMIDRYVRGEELAQRALPELPRVYVPAVEVPAGTELAARAHQQAVAVEERVSGFVECEVSLTEEQARVEARRCLRCDLEFTRPAETKETVVQAAAEE